MSDTLSAALRTQVCELLVCELLGCNRSAETPSGVVMCGSELKSQRRCR